MANREALVTELFGGEDKFLEAWAAGIPVYTSGGSEVVIYSLPTIGFEQALSGIPNYYVYNTITNKIEGAFMSYLHAYQNAQLLAMTLQPEPEPEADKETDPRLS
jgi:hypothetical protein